MSSFMPNRTLLPDSDVYLVSSSITNTDIDIYEKYRPFPFLVMSHYIRQANTVQ
ncbi:hypothetical protein T11_6309 [Trichinella zimbabwensis]|uniref:Uncharacterized protein n=1 Tax=Trichinella zimbabwensis TaxID=268475 RepID=A0A0V1GJG6_9BILA|nr:hypothetical protein T11_6309 [Trichinella zimbabwensis]